MRPENCFSASSEYILKKEQCGIFKANLLNWQKKSTEQKLPELLMGWDRMQWPPVLAELHGGPSWEPQMSPQCCQHPQKGLPQLGYHMSRQGHGCGSAGDQCSYNVVQARTDDPWLSWTHGCRWAPRWGWSRPLRPIGPLGPDNLATPTRP